RSPRLPLLSFFFKTPPASVFSPLSLHDALPICSGSLPLRGAGAPGGSREPRHHGRHDFGLSRLWLGIIRGGEVGGALAKQTRMIDRKSTRLNSSHQIISYAVFCLKKKKKKKKHK